MRVISGSARGAVLASPAGLDTRPSADRLKEALFSIIAGRLPGAAVLDLFAGSGAIGIEALSRSAESCVFVDSNRAAMDIIKANLKKTRLDGHAELLCMDCLAALRYLTGKKRHFELIYIDPPYAGGLYDKCMELILSYSLLAYEGIVICESDSENLPMARGYDLLDERKYGKARLTFWRRSDAGDLSGKL